MTINENNPVGFVGLGIMGRHMAAHLLDGGFTVHLHTRTKQKAAELLTGGARWHDSAGGVARHVDVVITMVGTPAEVGDVYFGSDGLIEHARPGSYLVDMTTSEPELAVRIHEAARLKDLRALDAPVSGGERGAREAKLTVMAGGDSAAFEGVLPLLERLGSTVVHQGPAGSGQHAKLCNQIVNANTLVGVAEGLAYAQAAGLDVATVLESITAGSAASYHLSNTGPKMVAGDFAPGFAIHHMVKDLAIAASEAGSRGLELNGMRGALERYRRLVEEGAGGDGIQAVYRACLPGRTPG